MTQRSEEPLPDGRFDAAHFRAVHRHLFQDVYDWAGEPRTIRTFKDGSPFCYPESFEPELAKLFGWLGAWDCPRRQTASGEVVGVEVTYLAANGMRARLALPRKTDGRCPAGAAVRLAPAGPCLLAGEGVFTCLSAAGRFGLPAWALCHPHLWCRRPPPSVGFVLIATDRSADGKALGADAGRAPACIGVAVALRRPAAPHGD